MSLILDALRKSEAERQRGQPPTLYAHFNAPRRVRRTPWVAGAGAVLLAAGLAGSGLWLSRGRDGDATEGAGSPIAQAGTPTIQDKADRAAATQPVALGATAAQLETVAAVEPAPDAVTVEPARETVFGGVAGAGDGGTVSGGGLPVPQRAMLYTPSATPVPESAANDPAPGAAPPPAPEAPVVVAAPPAEQPAPDQPPSIQPPPAVVDHGPSGPTGIEAAPSKPEEVLPVMFQLPYATRKDLPKLELSMHVFSPEPAERFIVLNGKRFTLETPAPGPELTLLDIVADGAVFEFRGQRFLLPRQTY